MRILLSCVLSLVLAGTAAAQETTTYTYDVHGRLVGASRSTGPNTTYAYDGGDSRTSRVTVGGSSLMGAAEPADEVEAEEAAPDAVPEPAEAPPEPDTEAQQD
jgi:YD repeat-containing protein